MEKLPQDQLTELIDIAEQGLRVSGNLTQAIHMLEKIAFNRGFTVDKVEVKEQLVAKLALEVNKILNR